MLEIFREIEASGQELIVTDRRQAGIKDHPIREKSDCGRGFGRYYGQGCQSRRYEYAYKINDRAGHRGTFGRSTRQPGQPGEIFDRLSAW